MKQKETEKMTSGQHLIEIRSDSGKIIRRKVVTINNEPSMTQQQFKDETDATTIIKKYGTTGISPFVRTDGYYADLTQIPDLSSALQTVKDAENAFQSLSSDVRTRFGNDPVNMIEFIKDEKNRDEAEKLGLLKPKEPAPAPVQVEVINQPSPTAPQS